MLSFAGPHRADLHNTEKVLHADSNTLAKDERFFVMPVPIYLLSTEQEVSLVEDIMREEGKRGADEQKQYPLNREQMTLIENNLPLVYSLALRFVGRAMDFEDLYQEGCIGLINAAISFDEMRGAFSTHATWCIRSAIWRALEEKSRLIRLPAYLYRRLGVLARIQQELYIELGRVPTEEDLAEKMRVDVKDIHHLLTASLSPQSLDAPLEMDESLCLEDILEDPTVHNSAENVEQEEMHALVQELLAHLTPRRRTILRLRYGFDEESRTFAEVGRTLGVTRQSVQTTEKKAFAQLQHVYQRLTVRSQRMGKQTRNERASL